MQKPPSRNASDGPGLEAHSSAGQSGKASGGTAMQSVNIYGQEVVRAAMKCRTLQPAESDMKPEE